MARTRNTPAEPGPPQQSAPPPAKPHRLTHSEIIEQLLQRRVGASSTVSLTRNARGQTQVAVTVATGEREHEPRTALEAAALAKEIYDSLAADYPLETPEPPAEPKPS